MGLDMYLYVDKYVSRKDYNKKVGDYDFATNEAFNTIVAALNAESVVDNEWTGLTVQLPVGYWRKANAIHSWIVENLADGVDECQRIVIPRAAAEELVSACKEVVAEPELAFTLLPPRSGFFFGSTEVDEYYINDLKYTIQVFEKALSDADIDYLIYQASW